MITLSQWTFPDLFILIFKTVNKKYVHYKILPKTGFELWTYGIRSDWLCQLSHNHCQLFLSLFTLPPKCDVLR